MTTRVLSVADADQALRYYSQAFGAAALSRSRTDGGVSIQATLAIDGSILVLSEPAVGDRPDVAHPGMALHHLVTSAVGAIWDAALAAGAEAWSDLEADSDEVSGILRDPFGHVWQILTRRPTVFELETAAARIRACWEPELTKAERLPSLRAAEESPISES